ncbi:uncharacterized protein LOC133391731 [Anopheles gambiae]|uniref:uncharacterized protein LOC133391731 n=1 Tax=Anopheles gambiae TaxID=7165 RepID=UPI002AC90EF5|nr:uncharacterized protein LOC133391731 [Anopheles gambiae]
MLTKDQMLCALECVNVPVSPNATIAQIRKMYETTFESVQNMNNPYDVPSVSGKPKEETALALQSETHVSENNATTMTHTENDVTAILRNEHDTATLDSSIAGNPQSDTPNINDEIEMLKKKLEILELKQRITALEAPTVPFPGPQPPIFNFEEIVDKFSGDNKDHMERWFKELERAFLPYNMDNTMKLHYTRRLLTGTAAKFEKSLDFTAYHELKDSLIETFSETKSLENVYKQLRSRQLGRNKSITRYVLDMQALAWGTPVPEEDLVNIIIDGINDPINTASIRFAARSLTDLKRLLKRYEQIRPQHIATPSSSGTIRQPSNVSRTSDNQQAPAVVRCYNCSQFGRYQNSCPIPRRPPGSCFKCHQVGHAARNCPIKIIIPSAAAHYKDQGNKDQGTTLDEFEQEAQ